MYHHDVQYHEVPYASTTIGRQHAKTHERHHAVHVMTLTTYADHLVHSRAGFSISCSSHQLYNLQAPREEGSKVYKAKSNKNSCTTQSLPTTLGPSSQFRIRIL
jgi:hypothetical protein